MLWGLKGSEALKEVKPGAFEALEEVKPGALGGPIGARGGEAWSVLEGRLHRLRISVAAAPPNPHLG